MLCYGLAGISMMAGAQDFKVQGIDYGSTLTGRTVKKAPAFAQKRVTANPEGISDLSQIKFWAGDGMNRAALVFQWNVDGETHARAYGYRYNGEATGYDMLKAVVEEAPELFALVSYTYNPEGYVLGGAGLSPERGTAIEISDGKTTYTMALNELFTSTGGYNYDDYSCNTQGAFWQSGWFDGYWSYWTGSPEYFGYSGLGMSASTLYDGCWNYWNYSDVADPENPQPTNLTWLPIEAAEDYVPANSVSEVVYNGIRYIVTNPRLRTVWVASSSSTPYQGDVVIPSDFASGQNIFYVTGVAENAFANSQVTSVVLPNTVEVIGDNAFTDCKSLVNVTLPKELKYYGDGLFKGCSAMTSLIWPAGYNTVKPYQFAGTGITSLTLPENITSLGEGAFSDCASLATLNFDAKIDELGEKAFYGAGLKNIQILQTVPPTAYANTFDADTYSSAVLTVPAGYAATYGAAEGWSNFKTINEISLEVNVGDKFIVNGIRYQITSTEANTVKVTHYGEQTQSWNISPDNAAGYTGEIVIPSTVTYMGRTFDVNEFDDYAMYGASMTALTVPASIKTWNKYAAGASKSLVKLTLEQGITEIGSYAFYDCSALETLPIPTSLRTVREHAFDYCKSLKTFDGELGYIDYYYDYCFARCGFETVKLGSSYRPNGKTSLGYLTYGGYVFAGCENLKEIQFPTGFGGKYPPQGGDIPNFIAWFQDCTALESVDLSNTNLTYISDSMFSRCSSLKEVKLPAGITSIKSMAFSSTAIEHFDLPESLTEIGTSAFLRNNVIEEITIPAGVTEIPSSMISYCPNLKKVVIEGNIKKIGDWPFQFDSALKEIVFTAAEPVEGKIALPYGLEYLGKAAFKDFPFDFAVPETVRTYEYDCLKNTKTSLIHILATDKIDSEPFAGCPDDLVIYCSALNPCIPHMYAFHKTDYYDSELYRIRIPDGYESQYKKAKYSYMTTSEWEDAGLDTPGFSGMEATNVEIAGDLLYLNPVPVYEHSDWLKSFLDRNSYSIYGLGDCSVVCVPVNAENSARAAANDEDPFENGIVLDGTDHGYGQPVVSDIKSLKPGTYAARVKYEDFGGMYGNKYGPEFYFTKEISTGVETVAGDYETLVVKGNTLTAEALEGQTLRIFDLSGAIMDEAVVEGNLYQHSIDLQAGVYVARCGKCVVKFVID